MIHVEESVHHFLVAFKHRRFKEISQLNVLSNDVSANFEDVLERVNALQKDLRLINDQLKPFVPSHCKLSLVPCFYMLF